jgi:hypothetical protein
MSRTMTILSVGLLPELVSLRDAVLRSVGFNVFSTCDPEEAYVQMQRARFGVLLLCYSLSDAVRQRLAQRFRHCCPRGRIVAISNERVDDTPPYVDTVFYGVEGAEALIDNVRAQLPPNRTGIGRTAA